MSPAFLFLLLLSAALFIGITLPVACGSALKEVHLIIEENGTKNETNEIEQDVNMTEYIVDIPCGDHNKSIELKEVIAFQDGDNDTEEVYGAKLSRSFIGPTRPRFSHHQVEVERLPKCAIGYMKSDCVATFITPHIALTAASCVVDRITETPKLNLDLWRGESCRRRGRLMHEGEVKIRTYPREYVYSTSHEDYNYALISYIDRSSCYLGFGSDGGWTNDGFETFRNVRSPKCPHPSIRSLSCDPYEVGEHRFRCRRDVTGTNIGSPLVTQDIPSQQKVYGIVTESTTTHVSGVRITKDSILSLIEVVESGRRSLQLE